MNCPKCNGKFEPLTTHNIEVDRCINCRGIWFDNMENEHLASFPDAEKIDIGDAVEGKKYDRISNINCPKCKTMMVRMLDDRHGHQVWFEICNICSGAFFDAGEFKEYAQEEGALMEFLHKFF